MINYFYDCYSILGKVYGEGAYLKQAILSTVIEEKNRSLIVKTCYGVLDKDIELSYYIKYLTSKTPKLAIRTILKIAMYAIKYLDKHVYAVTENAVELTKKLGKGGTAGFVNAFLRKFSTTSIKLPENDIEYLSIMYSYPDFAVKELIKNYGKEKTISILGSENISTCVCFYDADGQKYLESLGVKYEKTPFENVFLTKNFVRNSDYDKGVYTFQSLGSVAICEIIEKGGRLLDCCAAPGGKSVRLSYKFDQVESWDIHEHRVNLINEYTKRMGRKNIVSSVKDASLFDENLVSRFDTVLCDAPCSGFGVVGDNPDIKLRRKEENISELNKLQISILKNVSNYVAPGGFLYYSTCSILFRENIDIINAFMSDIKNFELVSIDSPVPHFNVGKALQFLPDISFGSGYFIAKLKRVN